MKIQGKLFNDIKAALIAGMLKVNATYSCGIQFKTLQEMRDYFVIPDNGYASDIAFMWALLRNDYNWRDLYWNATHDDRTLQDSHFEVVFKKILRDNIIL